MISLMRLLLCVVIAYFAGRLFAKIKMPSILGWLITGMILGPCAVGLVDETILQAFWYEKMIHLFECSVGLMIGTELVWQKIKKSGKAIIITTLTQSLGTYFVVALAFSLIFYFMDIPIYLAFVFGGIALATAPAPALSIVREFKAKGPVTNTLIPMAALDDIVGCVMFFITIAIVAGKLAVGQLPTSAIIMVILLPLIIGVLIGLLAGKLLQKDRSKKASLGLLIALIVFTTVVGELFNHLIMPKPVLNFMLIGMAFSATFANMISMERLHSLMDSFGPCLGIAMIVVILNLGAPLDYHLILGAGAFTAVYIIMRACGKYFGAYFGAWMTGCEPTEKKYLGLTLLPHSGVSLVFTGIAVSILQGPDPKSAQIIQGTIAAAAVINEVIAVIIAKKGFELAQEIPTKKA